MKLPEKLLFQCWATIILGIKVMLFDLRPTTVNDLKNHVKSIQVLCQKKDIHGI